MIPQRVSLLTIGAYDLPSLRAFYQRLGWEEPATSSDNYASFLTAGVILSLFPIEELAKDAGITFNQDRNSYRPVTFAINVDEPSQVDKIMEQIREIGGTVLREPSDAFWGGRTAYFADPENNLWEVAWNPTAVFDERGGMISY
ncbi:VOC family protein [Paenibacillus glycanilyticus]|uniref:Glyoxalase n=1 Tax=Paenibacillus glycanilyticus TaxID=126569 RepID=A0ABQ6GJA7_9BACL|nr:VOC family protein [Paenibacillus glycanilyticus]GLX71019.1 glyoxalase [Paenibacillus glycanilyticus]